MITLADVVKALKDLIEISKRTEKNTEGIKELKEEVKGVKEEIRELIRGQKTLAKSLESLEYGQKEILTRLNVWERLTKLEETVAKLEEKAKT